MTYTLAQAAQAAIDVQDACNLSGVVHSFKDIVTSLRNDTGIHYGHSMGTRELNTHPIVQLFASKVSDLAGLGAGDYQVWQAAYTACQKLAAT